MVKIEAFLVESAPPQNQLLLLLLASHVYLRVSHPVEFQFQFQFQQHRHHRQYRSTPKMIPTKNLYKTLSLSLSQVSQLAHICFCPSCPSCTAFVVVAVVVVHRRLHVPFEYDHDHEHELRICLHAHRPLQRYRMLPHDTRHKSIVLGQPFSLSWPPCACAYNYQYRYYLYLYLY